MGGMNQLGMIELRLKARKQMYLTFKMANGVEPHNDLGHSEDTKKRLDTNGKVNNSGLH